MLYIISQNMRIDVVGGSFLTRFKAEMDEKVYLQESVYICYLCVLSPHSLVWVLGSLLKACFLGFFP